MGAVISLPAYPGATSYSVQYSDPLVGNPNKPYPFAWTTLATGIVSPSNIPDVTGNPMLRLYRAQPTILVGATPVTLQWYDPFTAKQEGNLNYLQPLFDPQITGMLNDFRSYIGDYGTPTAASTNINIDSGAGIGLLLPDGVRTTFSLAEIPDSHPPVVKEYSVTVTKNAIDLLLNTDFTMDYQRGMITFVTAPLASDSIDIRFDEVSYTNLWLNSAISGGINSLASFRINGYGIASDNNVKTVVGIIQNDGLKNIIFALALKILNRALIRVKSEQARAYKVDTYSIDTVPGRILDGMSKQSADDFSEIKVMANQYIKTATQPMVRDAYASFFDPSGLLPSFNIIVNAYYASGYGFWT
jgi:hypothetical protein